MNQLFMGRYIITAIILSFMVLTVTGNATVVLAQDGNPIAVTETPQPVDPTNTPVPSNPNPPSGPTQIPEPITVILFGSGLAALSASVARKRKKQ